MVGTVSRQTLDMGLGHQLGDRPVTTVMQPGVEMVDAATSLEEVRDLFLRSGRRFVLVSGVEGEPAGLITRMDLLRHLYSRQSDAGESLDNRMEGARPSRQSVVHLLRRVAPGWVWDLFEVVRRVADGLGVAGVPGWWGRFAICCWNAKARTSTWWWRETGSSLQRRSRRRPEDEPIPIDRSCRL